MQSNPNLVVFWMLAHIIHDTGLKSRLLAELHSACPSHTQLQAQALDQDICPLLHSVYYEVLRVRSAATVTRSVLEDTVLGGYTLRKGGIVMCPARIGHFDQEIWGPDADAFVPDRFNRKQGPEGDTKRGQTKHLRSFGQAPSMCPGRFFAKQEVLISVARILLTFGIQLADEGLGLPDILPSSLHSFGSVKPARDVRVFLDVRNGW